MGKATAQKTTKAPDPASRLPKGSIAPTPQWLARYGEKIHTTHSEPGLPPGRAYMRRPWFESLIDRDWIEARKSGRESTFTIADRKALELYRENVEACERSETRSCLANLVSASGGKSDSVADRRLYAQSYVARAEALMGPMGPTVRQVAILDMPYAQVAMARFGSRDVDHYDDTTGVFTSRPAPKSGRHTARIKEEFVAGVKLLTAAGRVTLGRGPVETVRDAVEAAVRSARPICDAIDVKLAEAQGNVGIAASITVAEAIARETGVAFDHEADELDYGGVPVTIKRGWREGSWMVAEAANA